MPGICCTWTRELRLVPKSTDTAEEHMHLLEPKKLIMRLHDGLHMQTKMLQYAAPNSYQGLHSSRSNWSNCLQIRKSSEDPAPSKGT